MFHCQALESGAFNTAFKCQRAWPHLDAERAGRQRTNHFSVVRRELRLIDLRIWVTMHVSSGRGRTQTPEFGYFPHLVMCFWAFPWKFSRIV